MAVCADADRVGERRHERKRSLMEAEPDVATLFAPDLAFEFFDQLSQRREVFRDGLTHFDVDHDAYVYILDDGSLIAVHGTRRSLDRGSFWRRPTGSDA